MNAPLPLVCEKKSGFEVWVDELGWLAGSVGWAGWLGWWAGSMGWVVAEAGVSAGPADLRPGQRVETE